MLRSVARKILNRLKPAPAPKVVVPTPDPGPSEEELAESLATMECGVQEVRERIEAGEPVLLLDVRESFETSGGIIPGATIIPLGKLPARWEELKSANEVVCYCAVGMRSLQAAMFLRERGIINATSMVGGISAWMDAGGEIIQPDAPRG